MSRFDTVECPKYVATPGLAVSHWEGHCWDVMGYRHGSIIRWCIDQLIPFVENGERVELPKFPESERLIDSPGACARFVLDELPLEPPMNPTKWAIKVILDTVIKTKEEREYGI